MLAALSEVQLRQPDYAIFENVSGFLDFKPGDGEVNVDHLQDGLSMGGPKLLIRVLTELGYLSLFKP